MKDHTKNILITLLFATVIGLVLFFVGYAVGSGRVAGIIIDAGIKYLKENNISIIGIDYKMDKARALSYILKFFT